MKLKKNKRLSQKNLLQREININISLLRFAKAFLILIFLLLGVFGIIEMINKSFSEQKRIIIEKSHINNLKKVVVDQAMNGLMQNASPSALRKHAVNGMIHEVNVTTAKYLNPSLETETYRVEFRKQTPGLEYALSSERFSKLYLADKNYILIISFPKEGIPVEFSKISEYKVIQTLNFGSLYKIKSEQDLSFNIIDLQVGETLLTQYMYTNKIEDKCVSGRYCSFMQIYFPSAYRENGNASLSSMCFAADEAASSNCDALISGIKVMQVR